MEKHKELSRAVLEQIVPPEIVDCFELQEVEESTDNITLSLHEHSDCIASRLSPDQFVRELNQGSYPDYRVNIWSKLISTKMLHVN